MVHSLAHVYELQGKVQEAQPLYEQSIGILKGRLLLNHPDVQQAIQNYDNFINNKDKTQSNRRYSLYGLGLGVITTAVLLWSKTKN